VDTGFGISKEKRAKLFQSFERLGAEKSKTEGAGIGLVITKRLVESMGGVIGVESVEDQGSVFWVEFPRYQVSELTSPSPLPVLVSKTKPDGQEIVSPSSEKNIQQPSVKSKRTPLVLCIEDNPLNLKLLTILLQKNGAFVLLEAVNGEMGVHIAKSVIPDLILSDIHLPDIDGYQIIAQLREDENTKDIPVIALTGDVMKEDIQQAEAAGFAGYVTKPVDIAVLFVSL
jgi:CheY-like chemotaxis protein